MAQPSPPLEKIGPYACANYSPVAAACSAHYSAVTAVQWCRQDLVRGGIWSREIIWGWRTKKYYEILAINSDKTVTRKRVYFFY